MIRSITIRGIGPHQSTTIDTDPRGVTVIAGASESGKSTIADAICYALWGFGRDGRPLDLARCQGVEIAASVSTSSRTMTRSMTLRDGQRGTPQRELITPDGTRASKTEADWLGELATLPGGSPNPLSLPERCRLALVPMSWRDLALGEGGGRPLRDALVAMLPRAMSTSQAVAAIMARNGATYRTGDTLDRKKAESLRAAASAARDHAKSGSCAAP